MDYDKNNCIIINGVPYGFDFIKQYIAENFSSEVDDWCAPTRILIDDSFFRVVNLIKGEKTINDWKQAVADDKTIESFAKWKP